MLFRSCSSPPWQTATGCHELFVVILAYFICFGKHSFPTRAAPPGIRIHTLALRSCVIFYSIITASGYDSRLPCSSTVLRCIIACQALLKVLFCILHSGQVTCCDIFHGVSLKALSISCNAHIKVMVNAAVLQQLKHGFKLQVNNSNPLFQTKPHPIFLPLSQSHPTVYYSHQFWNI